MSDDTVVNPDASATDSDSGPDPIIGKVIDGCVVQRKLGQGGMGVVYLAEHETLKQEFVLKILNPALTGAEDTVDRFFREAQACAQLNHPGIVAIQNVGQERDYYYIRMEFVEGDTLEEQIKQDSQLDWREATRMILDVADALSHAHQKGMIHRDIKPENIMLLPDGSVKVMDFGLAKHVHSSAKVSVTGQIVGTPFFMSPEQAGGKPTDARSDIYSLGVTLYYMVTGVKPFNGKNLQEIFLKHFFYAPESPKIYNDALPEALCEIVKRCLKKKKKERYQSAKALVRDLQSVLDNPNAALGDSAPAPTPAAAKVSAQQATEPVDADKTMVSGADGADDEGGVTVRVEGDTDIDDRTIQVAVEDDEGGATVRVDADEDGGATVRVSDKPLDRGGVGTVSFGSHAADDVGTVVIDNDDEEPAHAGLDLPESVIRAYGGEVAPSDRPKRDYKKIGIVAAAVILVPMALIFLFRSMASSNFSELKGRYDKIAKASNEERDPDQMAALATQLRSFADSNALAFSLGTEAKGMADKLSAMVAEQNEADREAIERKKRKEELEQERARKAKERTQLLAQIRLELTALTEVREGAEAAEKAGGSGYDQWTDYVKRAKLFLERFETSARKEKELAAYVDQIRFPVFVTSDPAGAEVWINGKATDKRTAARLMVRPGEKLEIKVHRDGFEDESKSKVADNLVQLDFTLRRKELVDPPLQLGQLTVSFGGGLEEEPLIMIHEPVVVADERQPGLMFVDQGGFLRSYALKKGRLQWPSDGTKTKVGNYGDPTPRVCLVPGRAVLVSSLRGFLSAHDPKSGDPLWREPAQLDSPATSTPVYKQVFKRIAVGCASGRVYFISDNNGEILGSFATENPVVSPPYFWGDSICLVGSTDNRLYAVDWRKSTELSRLDLGSDVVAGPIPLGRRLLVGTAAGQVHLISVSSDGKLTDERVVGDPLAEPVAGIRVAGDTFYFSAGRRLYGVHGDGQLRWKPMEAAARISAPFTPFEGELIYAGGEDGTLYAVSKATGEVRWRFRVKSSGSDGASTPIRYPPFVVGRRLYVIAGSRLHVLAAD